MDGEREGGRNKLLLEVECANPTWVASVGIVTALHSISHVLIWISHNIHIFQICCQDQIFSFWGGRFDLSALWVGALFCFSGFLCWIERRNELILFFLIFLYYFNIK